MKKKQGFTLVELVIVIIIVGILSIVAVPIYRSYTLKAIGTEGKALMGAIASAQQINYTKYGKFQVLAKTVYDREFGVNAKANKFFREFSIETRKIGVNNGWTAISVGVEGTKAAGLTIAMSADDYNGGNFYLSLYDNTGDEIERF